jgi:hypothetical protein
VGCSLEAQQAGQGGLLSVVAVALSRLCLFVLKVIELELVISLIDQGCHLFFVYFNVNLIGLG